MKKKISEYDNWENEKKKEYLKRYLECVRAVKRIEEQIKELETDELCPKSLRTDIVTVKTAYDEKDLSQYIANKDKLIKTMINTKSDKISIYQDIFARIERIDKEEEREVLTLKYINGMKWEEVLDEMNVSWTQAHRIHTRALTHLEIPNVE